MNPPPTGRRVLAVAVFAFALTFGWGTAVAQNLTDLSGLKGRYVGTSKVAVGKGNFFGSSRVRVVNPTPTSAKIIVTASVKSGSGSVALNNQFTLKNSGALKIQELAPGVTSGVKVGGVYAAAGRTIEFRGTFMVGKEVRDYSGTIKRSGNGKFKLTYSLFADGGKSPSHVYTYVGK